MASVVADVCTLGYYSLAELRSLHANVDATMTGLRCIVESRCLVKLMLATRH